MIASWEIFIMDQINEVDLDMTKENLERIEWKLDQVLVALAVRPVEQKSKTLTEESKLHLFTPKQHCALQMLLHGGVNQQIAERFNISPNTAKVHVRTIAKKLGVNTRSQIVMKMLQEFEAIDDNSYRILSGGIPKDWHRNYIEPCPFAKIYRQEKEG